MLTLEKLLIRQGDFNLRADWQVETGAHVSILGPSGGGKSTLLSALAGFTPLSAGRILLDGQDITGLPPGKRPFSLLFQDHNLFAHLTLTQNLALGLGSSLRLGEEVRARIEAALTEVGLAGMGGRKPASLSGGQQSRAALARLLLMSRPVVLLDEPFSALGPALKAEMLALVMATLGKSGATLLLVTHDPEDALQLGGQTVVLADGQAFAPSETAELLANPPAALQAYLGDQTRQ